MIEPGLIDMMVRLRGRGISDNRLMRAMESTPRRLFVRTDQQPEAYDEQDMPIACGQTLSAPLTIAIMTQTLGLAEDHKVLEVGTGSGYHTAILARLCRRVYSIERYKELHASAEAMFARLDINNAVCRHGDGRRGWSSQAPFDRIIVTCGLKTAPEGLLAQVKPGGRLAAVVAGRLTLFEKSETNIETRDILPLSIPMIEAGKSKAL